MVDKSMAFLHFQWCPTCVWLWGFLGASQACDPYPIMSTMAPKESRMRAAVFSVGRVGSTSGRGQSELSELETGKRAGAVLCPSQDQASSDELVLASSSSVWASGHVPGLHAPR